MVDPFISLEMENDKHKTVSIIVNNEVYGSVE